MVNIFKKKKKEVTLAKGRLKLKIVLRRKIMYSRIAYENTS